MHGGEYWGRLPFALAAEHAFANRYYFPGVKPDPFYKDGINYKQWRNLYKPTSSYRHWNQVMHPSFVPFDFPRYQPYYIPYTANKKKRKKRKKRNYY